MRLIFTVDPEALPAALKVVDEQMADGWEKRYDKPGWGWHFYKDGFRFFVRGIKGGMSVQQVKDKTKPDDGK